MKKLFKILFVLVFMIGVLFFSAAPILLDAKDAVCKHAASGDVCKGECCKTTLSGCKAGPCDIILR